MKSLLCIAVIFLLPSITLSAEKVISNQIDTSKKNLGYALGMDVGVSLIKMAPDIDLDSFFDGIRDAVEDKPFQLTIEESRRIKINFANRSSSQPLNTKMEIDQKRLDAGIAFLEKNKAKQGIITTKSGLQYLVLREKKGPTPKPRDMVTFYKKGILINGTVFEDSFAENSPTSKVVITMLRGLKEGILLMSSGSKYRFFLSPDLAYKNKYFGKSIKPYSTLIYDIELLSINNKDTPRVRDNVSQKQQPAIYKDTISPEIKKTTAKYFPLGLSTFSLETPKKAVSSFVQLHNLLMPTARNDSAKEICQAVATKNFYDECNVLLQERITKVKAFPISAADFAGLRLKDNPKEHTVEIKWLEVFTFRDGTKHTTNYHLEAWLTLIDKEWRIASFILKEDYPPKG